jgi:biotin--protein ligase
VQHRVGEAMLGHSNLGSAVGSELQREWGPLVFEDLNGDFHFYFLSFPLADRATDHLIFDLIPPNSFSNPKIKHVLVPSKPMTSEDERIYTTQFSPSAFFHVIDEFRSAMDNTNQDFWRIGELRRSGLQRPNNV